MVKRRVDYSRRKKKKSPVPFLIILNVILWGSGLYLWFRDSEWFSMGGVVGDLNQGRFESESRQLPVFNEANALASHEVSLELDSAHVLLINLTTHDVVFAQNSNERAYPASLTKIMTVLLGIEHTTNDELTVFADFNQLFIEGAAMAGFSYGETRTLEEVLHGMMLPSGADATTTLAYHVSGTYEAFVALMNEKAREIGMENTHFMNASGLHHPAHYSTAMDLAILFRYALQYEQFREIIMTPAYDITLEDGREHTMLNTMHALMFDTAFSGGEILGGKDGYTHEASWCLASFATDGADEYMLITLDAKSLHGHIFDAFDAYEYFFNW